MTTPTDVYFVDDDVDFREATHELLESAGLNVTAFSGGRDMLDRLDPEWGGAILCDVRMVDMDGFEVLKAVRAVATDIPFIMITGHGDVRLAIASIKAGAYDFVEKPVQPDFLISIMQRAVNARKLVIENRRLRRRVQNQSGLAGVIIGRSQAMRDIRTHVLRLATLPLNVCIFGELGTGKSMVARALHDHGMGAGAFVTIGCNATSPEDFRAELNAIGSDTATLFLRSLDQLDSKSQATLADFLKAPQTPRIIASLTGDADSAPEQNLSDDLYFLANVARLDMPPLRDRGRDVFILLEVFLRAASHRFEHRLPKVTKDMIKMLERHSWPGNARELNNVAERMVMGLPIDLNVRGARQTQSTSSYDDAMYQFERSLLSQSLRESGGRKGDAAALLSIPRKRLYLRMKAVGLSDTGQD